MLELNNENNKRIDDSREGSNFEARQNLSGFFDLLFKIAIREKIDIGQYENKRSSNNTDKTTVFSTEKTDFVYF